jgi:predicted glycosyltransferase
MARAQRPREGIVRIGFLMGRSFTEDRYQADIVTWLRQWGATAEPLHLGDDLIDVARVSLDHDLFVLKSRSDLAMSVAADLHGAGARLLNPYPVSALLRDRVVTFRVLRTAGVPVPETFAASHPSQLLPALDRGPLIVKPYRRYKRHRPEVVTNAAELAALDPIEEPVFAQRYHLPDGPDRLVYSLGSELFGVLRGPQGAPFALSPELVDIARRCGAALGIDLFGINVVESAGRPYVVDMSSFPSFRGVPDAARRVAKYVLKAAERAACGEPVVPAELQRAPGRAATQRALFGKGSSLQLVLGALSDTEATPQELAQIENVVDDIRLRSTAATSPPRVRAGRPRRDSRPTQAPSPPRVAMYSQGMVGFGHIRRNASIAQALRASELQPGIVMIAEAWQAGALLLPEGVDCVTLPALRREPDGGYNPRFLLDVSDQDLIALRTRVIRSAIEVFDPDVLIVDYLPLGVAGELATTLERLRTRGNTRCVLGLRDVLYDSETVRRTWADRANMDAIRSFYDAVWIYGDPAVFDPVREYGLGPDVAAKARYTGYLDQRPRLDLAAARGDPMLESLPPAKLALCLVGGGHDGQALAEAFLQAELPDDTSGVLVTGPLMPWEQRQQVRCGAQQRSRFRVLDFVPEPIALIERADRVIAMGGYNTCCEILSFEKHALIVPRVAPEPEQWIRAERLRDLGLVEVLHPERLEPRALSEWLARDLGSAPSVRDRVDLAGLTRIPVLLQALLGAAASPVPLAV